MDQSRGDTVGKGSSERYPFQGRVRVYRHLGCMDAMVGFDLEEVSRVNGVAILKHSP